MLCNECSVEQRLMVQPLYLKCDEFLGFSGRAGGMRELEPVLLLFCGTVFFEAMEEE